MSIGGSDNSSFTFNSSLVGNLGNGSSSTLDVTFGPLTGTSRAQVETSVANSGTGLVSEPYSYTMTLTSTDSSGGKTSLPIYHYNQGMASRDIPIAQGTASSGNYTTGVLVSSDGSVSPVPTQFAEVSDNKLSIATI